MAVSGQSRDDLILLLALAPADGDAIRRVMEDAGLSTRPCRPGDLSQEVRAGVGAIITAEEAMTGPLVRKLAALLETQPIWSDIPLVILTTHNREESAQWLRIRNAVSTRNVSLLERPMKIATLVQTMRVALGARLKQYRLRDQIGEREQILARSERNEQRLSAVLNNTRMSVFFMDERQHCTFMNAAAETLTGFTLHETRGRSLHDTIHHTHPDGRPYPLHDCPIDRAFPGNNQTEGEEVFVHKDGHFYPVAFTASPIRQEDVIVGTVIEVRDITVEKNDTARLNMMMNELNHRVKNTLATVQSIFLQTLRRESVPDQAIERVMSRLMALSRSHDLLTENSWLSAPLREVALRALAPFGAADDPAGRFTLRGDASELLSKPALAVAMALHELATNAVKHGALGVAAGRVDLSWQRVPGGILRLTWVERGGPAVHEPVHSGFGRRLIERGLVHELGGAARLGFHPDGLICEIDIPMATALVARQKESG